MCVQIIIKPLIILIDKFLIFICKKIFFNFSKAHKEQNSFFN